MPITIFDSDPIPRDRRAELEAAVVAAGRHLKKLFEGWIAATPDRRKFAVRITSYPEVDFRCRSTGTRPRPRSPSGCARRWKIAARGCESVRDLQWSHDRSIATHIPVAGSGAPTSGRGAGVASGSAGVASGSARGGARSHPRARIL